MFAIETHYHGPTDRKGARISARIADGRKLTNHCPSQVFIPYDHALDAPKNHIAAARTLLAIVAPWGTWHAGETRRGYVFCRCDHGIVPWGVTIPLIVK